jgi:hypothetical protein
LSAEEKNEQEEEEEENERPMTTIRYLLV